MTQRRCSAVSSRHGTSTGTPRLRAYLSEVVLALAVGLGLPRPHRAAAQRLASSGNDQPVVDADHAAEAAARVAGPSGELNENRLGVGSR